jgi:hypothetical protein
MQQQRGNKMKYEIWQNNGTSMIFEYDSDDFDEVLNAFCAEAGYVDHSDYATTFGLSDSPFNIKKID